ncbi:translation initiation factor Sui1 [Candidatus Latescibacterota bacterium]
MAAKNRKSSGIVYSTEQGTMCPQCVKPAAHCICRHITRLQNGDGVVRVGRSTKGRKGKGVTVVNGIPLAHDDLSKLAQKLKRICASGGTVKDGVIEIQGDFRDKVMEELSKAGYTVKRSGG